MDCLKPAGIRNTFQGARILLACLLTLCVESGCTLALLNASTSGDRDTAVGLLRSGEDIQTKFPVVGTTPVMLAAAHGHIEVLRTLLEAGADVNAVDFTGWTALHAAASNGSKDVVLLLLEHGALAAEDHWYLPSPAGIAHMLGHEKLVPLLTRPPTTPLPLRDSNESQ